MFDSREAHQYDQGPGSRSKRHRRSSRDVWFRVRRSGPLGAKRCGRGLPRSFGLPLPSSSVCMKRLRHCADVLHDGPCWGVLVLASKRRPRMLIPPLPGRQRSRRQGRPACAAAPAIACHVAAAAGSAARRLVYTKWHSTAPIIIAPPSITCAPGRSPNMLQIQNGASAVSSSRNRPVCDGAT